MPERRKAIPSIRPDHASRVETETNAMTIVHMDEARLKAIRDAAQANGADEHLIEAAGDALAHLETYLWVRAVRPLTWTSTTPSSAPCRRQNDERRAP